MADEATKRQADKIMAALEGKPELRAELEIRMGPLLAVCQDWEESERGWGVRPDGHTLHLTREDRDAYVAGHAEVFRSDDVVPDEYTRESGRPRLVKVAAAVYQRLIDQRDKVVGDGDDGLHYEFQRFGIWGHHSRSGPPAYQGEDP